MKLTRKSVIIDTTNRIGDCLEAGGICGRRVAYPIHLAEAATGLTRAELAAAEPSEKISLGGMSLAQLIEWRVPGRVVRRGTVIR